MDPLLSYSQNKLRMIISHFYKSQISEKDISNTITSYFIILFQLSHFEIIHICTTTGGGDNLNQIEKLP